MNEAGVTTTDIVLRPWVTMEALPAAEPVFMFDDEKLPDNLANVSVVMRDGGKERAVELIARGAERVLIGEAALLDAALITSLIGELGAEKIGVWVPAQRRHVSWTLDIESNADFRCLTPSYGKVSWEVLKNDGSGTGTDVEWWTGQMFKLGVTQALVGADIKDDEDLNICAGLVELFGSSLWIAPLSNPEADMLPWIQLGQARQLAIPAARYADEAGMAALRDALKAPEEEAAASGELNQFDEGVSTKTGETEKLGMAIESELPDELKL